MKQLLCATFWALSTGNECDITDYGASTSSSDNAKAITKAISDCLSGGKVLIPKGTFKTGPLLIEKGDGLIIDLESQKSVLMGLPRSDWTKSNGKYVDFIQFVDCKRCKLKGNGIIDGGSGTKWYEEFDAKSAWQKDDPRPNMLIIQGGKDFTLRDITLLNSPKINVKLKGISGAEVDAINITSSWYNGGKGEPHNTDGINPGSDAHDIYIHDVYISNGDDFIAIKPGTEKGGCTRNITVAHSEFHKGHGLSIGSIGEGCIENIVFYNNTLKAASNGARIKTYAPEPYGKPGYVKDITWQKIDMKDTKVCISVNAEYKPTPSDAKDFIQVSDIKMLDITSHKDCKKTDAEFLCPKKEPCKSILLEDVTVSGSDGMHCSNAYGTAKRSITDCFKSSQADVFV